jgi:hypothetical protein
MKWASPKAAGMAASSVAAWPRPRRVSVPTRSPTQHPGGVGLACSHVLENAAR